MKPFSPKERDLIPPLPHQKLDSELSLAYLRGDVKLGHNIYRITKTSYLASYNWVGQGSQTMLIPGKSQIAHSRWSRAYMKSQDVLLNGHKLALLGSLQETMVRITETTMLHNIQSVLLSLEFARSSSCTLFLTVKLVISLLAAQHSAQCCHGFKVKEPRFDSAPKRLATRFS